VHHLLTRSMQVFVLFYWHMHSSTLLVFHLNDVAGNIILATGFAISQPLQCNETVVTAGLYGKYHK